MEVNIHLKTSPMCRAGIFDPSKRPKDPMKLKGAATGRPPQPVLHSASRFQPQKAGEDRLSEITEQESKAPICNRGCSDTGKDGC
jgi:hypothetical protein